MQADSLTKTLTRMQEKSRHDQASWKLVRSKTHEIMSAAYERNRCNLRCGDCSDRQEKESQPLAMIIGFRPKRGRRKCTGPKPFVA